MQRTALGAGRGPAVAPCRQENQPSPRPPWSYLRFRAEEGLVQPWTQLCDPQDRQEDLLPPTHYSTQPCPGLRASQGLHWGLQREFAG